MLTRPQGRDFLRLRRVNHLGARRNDDVRAWLRQVGTLVGLLRLFQRRRRTNHVGLCHWYRLVWLRGRHTSLFLLQYADGSFSTRIGRSPLGHARTQGVVIRSRSSRSNSGSDANPPLRNSGSFFKKPAWRECRGPEQKGSSSAPASRTQGAASASIRAPIVRRARGDRGSRIRTPGPPIASSFSGRGNSSVSEGRQPNSWRCHPGPA